MYMLLLPRGDEHNTADERRGARDGRQRHGVCFFLGSLDGPKIDNLFGGLIRESPPGQTDQTNDYQNHSKRLAHRKLLLRLLLNVGIRRYDLLTWYFILRDFSRRDFRNIGIGGIFHTANN